MKRRPRGPALLLGFGLALATPAFADEPEPSTDARSEYGAGTRAFSKKQYPEAALHFEAAAALKPNAIALYTAALAWDLANRPERAADAYSRSLDVVGLDARQGANARTQLASLEKTLGTVAITAPEGWRVQLESYSEVPTPARLHGPPGQHVVAVRAPGKPLERREVMLEAGKLQTLDLQEAPKATHVEEPEPKHEPPRQADVPLRLQPDPFWTTWRVAGIGAGGFGVAALVATAILGTNANASADAYKSAPTRASFDHASSLETWTNITLVSGIVLVAAGVALLVFPFGEKHGERTAKALGGQF